jgi:hypothetical protein
VGDDSKGPFSIIRQVFIVVKDAVIPVLVNVLCNRILKFPDGAIPFRGEMVSPGKERADFLLHNPKGLKK